MEKILLLTSCAIFMQHNVRNNYKSCYVVFDGYEGKSTKSIEHLRRASTHPICPNIDVKGCSKVVFTQERFLSNNDNKSKFIKLLAKKLTEESHTVEICKGGADTAIVPTTLKTARMSKKMVVTVADDTDIAVMLLYHWKKHHGDIVSFSQDGTEVGT